ncbi:hypothetical protein QR680_005604 [Steinernema hermaphroditum]|uniref:7TM GPCR serpentine receptor class x (Srx) domain-containing protein n=1 Tax=Steinernema hermaphroditum TaxID=289476 RepID=A0AA39HTQ6_9BILA|nr:hypothetical protein QR680_005604 [Steinernema hermaphroditum]
MAIYLPFRFRRLRQEHAFLVLGAIILVGFGLTAPLFFPCCGYKFYLETFSWAFDLSKPYTFVYITLNVVLQSICFGTMVILDVLIVVKVSKDRGRLYQNAGFSGNTLFRTSNTSASGVQIAARPGISMETRLSVSFLFLSLCFFGSNIIFNTSQYWCPPHLAGDLSALGVFLLHGKCLSYVIFGRLFRGEIRKMLCCRV